jgi:C-methyltransferase
MMQVYKETSLLRTAIELGIFDTIADGFSTVEEVAKRLDAHPRGVRILLNALAAVRLLETSDAATFRLPEAVSTFLVRNSPQYVGGMARVFASDFEWDALRGLSSAVRAGGTVQEVHAETPEYSYWEDFASYAVTVAQPTADIAAEVMAPWTAGRKNLDILDVACGHGVYGYTLTARNPQAQVWSLDWPNVLAVTEKHAERLGVRDRAHFITGDMFEVPLGGPYDVVFVTNVTHHFSAERVTELLKRLSTVVKPDGRIVLIGFTVGDEPPVQDPAPHLFSVLMLVWTFEGESHSVATYNKALNAAGFTNATVHHTELPFRILVADRK